MPRRKQDEAVEKRAQQLLEEKGQRRRAGAEKAAQTRRRGRPEQQAEAQDQTKPKRATRAKRERKEHKPRVHKYLLTVSYRGPLAGRFRDLAAQQEMSLAKLMQDALLTYEKNLAAGYRAGAALEEWIAEQEREEAQEG